MTTQCNCEHIRHFPEEWEGKQYLKGHKYLTGRSTGQRAEFVGPVCDWCAEHCVKIWLIK
jgi:hypothetical protein